MNLSKWLKSSAMTALLRLFPLVLLASLADAALLYAIRNFIQILEKTISVSIAEWLCVTLVLVVLRWGFSYLRGISVEKTSRHVEAGLLLWFARRLRTLSPQFYHAEESEERLMVAYDSIHTVSASAEALMQTLQAILQLVIFLPVLFVISPWLTLVVLLVVLPVISLIQKKLHAMKPSVEEEMTKRGELRSEMEAAKRFFRLWSSAEDLSRIVQGLFSRVRSVLASGVSVGRRKVALAQGMETLSVFSVVLILGFCGWMILNGKLDAEGLILYCSALFLCYKPVKECSRLLPQMRLAKSAENVLVALENAPRKKRLQSHAKNTLELSQIEFSYTDDMEKAPVFCGMDFLLQTGKPVLLQGPNGCGKSTFFKLVAGLEEPQKGSVLLPQSFAENGVFSVSQDLVLPPREFVLQKIQALQENAAFAELWKLVRGEKLLQKKGLSGGERAKVALLWAIASPAKILLLDEPFAFIAQEERAPILVALLAAAKARGKWVLLATHEPMSNELTERFEILDFLKREGCA
ncbi:MAG: ATP-binding cassette domain-containing protein [Fibrobacter sp.]|nr:ATP-binding cassette domain-containing protein [Fibrobacter sp.]